MLALGLTVTLVAGACAAETSSDSGLKSVLDGEYQIAAQRSAEARHYEMETEVVTFSPSGQVLSSATYGLLLSATPAGPGDEWDARYRCVQFTVSSDGDAAFSLAALEGWSYPFTLYPAEGEESRPPLGIPHEPFIDLTDNDGQLLQPSVRYAVYNSFIDFHSLCDLLARPTVEGRGIQDLTRIGQRIVHVAANTEARIDLGDVIEKGSTFKNGEITLEFRGLGSVDGVACAIMGFDSGEASFNMTMKPVPNMVIEVVGRSHFLAEIFIELKSGWVRKATLNEMVLSEVTSSEQILDTSTSERTLAIRAISEEQLAGR
jgi:hypothetical protein